LTIDTTFEQTSLVNYYKILGLENYATIKDVKSAYKALVKQYHPDINADEDAEEMTKYLNIAKGILTTPASKNEYDKQLKLAYLIEISRLKKQSKLSQKKSKNPYWNALSRDERKAKLEEARKIRIKEKYEKSLSRFPRYLRILGFTIGSIWGIQLMYSHYFLGYDSNDYLLLVLGYFILGGTLALGASEVYTFYVSKSVHEPVGFHFERYIALSFVSMFILGIVGVTLINEWRKNDLLSHDFAYTTAHINFDQSSLDQLVVTYEVGLTIYVKKIEVSFTDIVKLPENNTILKYAPSNPLICEVVIKNEEGMEAFLDLDVF